MVPSSLQNEIGYGREKTYQKLEKLGEVTPPCTQYTLAHSPITHVSEVSLRGLL